MYTVHQICPLLCTQPAVGASCQLHPFIFPTLPACLPPSLSASLPACLFPCLPDCLPPSLPACLFPCLPDCLPPSLPACLFPCLPDCLLPPCLPASLPPSTGIQISCLMPPELDQRHVLKLILPLHCCIITYVSTSLWSVCTSP